MENIDQIRLPKKLIWFLKEKLGKGCWKGPCIHRLVLGWQGERSFSVRMKPRYEAAARKRHQGCRRVWADERAGRLQRWEQAGEEEDPQRHGAGEAGRGHIHSVLDSAHLNCLPLLRAWFYSQVLGIREGTNTPILTVTGSSILAEEKNSKPAIKYGLWQMLTSSGGKYKVGRRIWNVWGVAELTFQILKPKKALLGRL